MRTEYGGQHRRNRDHPDRSVRPVLEPALFMAGAAPLRGLWTSPGGARHVLADPEGNEFCLLKGRLNPL
jgi:hypothetical protein